MARKRLSDLLREEEQKGGEKAASKSSADNANPSPEAAQEVVKPDSKEPAVVVTSEVIDPAQVDQTGKSGTELRSAAIEEPETPAQADPENTDLQNTIEQLKTELQSLQQSLQQKVQETAEKEAALQAQIERLTAETTAQQSKIQQLQTEAEQSAQVKTELEEAKQMILKLSQPSSTASKPAASQPAKPNPAVLPTVRAAEPELDSKPVEMVIPPKNKTAAAERPKLHQMALRKVLDHPTQPGSLPPMPSEAKKTTDKEVKLSDADVGWMD
jgi:chromosome segregation ATPase